MKTTSRQIVLTGITVMLALSGGPSLSVHAIPTTTNNSPEPFCARITNLAATSQATVETRMTAMRTSFTNRLAKLASAQTDVDKKIAIQRTSATQQFEQKIADMLATDGLSDAKKQAIETFKSEVQKAEATRASAVDRARQTYRSNLSDTISAHQASLTQSATAYQDAVRASFSKASADCGNTSAATTLRASVKTARQAMTTTQSTQQVASDIKAMAESRRIEIVTVNETFSSAVQQYAATLSAALDSSDSAP